MSKIEFIEEGLVVAEVDAIPTGERSDCGHAGAGSNYRFTLHDTVILCRSCLREDPSVRLYA